MYLYSIHIMHNLGLPFFPNIHHYSKGYDFLGDLSVLSIGISPRCLKIMQVTHRGSRMLNKISSTKTTETT